MSFVFPTWCEGEIHNLVLTRDGRMVSQGDEHDFELEAALAELGGHLPHCLWHYNRWLKNPLNWVQGPLFSAWAYDANMDPKLFSSPLGFDWQEQNLRFLSGLLLLDMAEHAVGQLSDKLVVKHIDMPAILFPIRAARRSYTSQRAHHDVTIARRDLHDLSVLRMREHKGNLRAVRSDRRILRFVGHTSDWATSGWWIDYRLEGLDRLYAMFLEIGDAEEQDAWLRRRIARVLESLIEEQRWPSMS
jgi:hypothetical protein